MHAKSLIDRLGIPVMKALNHHVFETSHSDAHASDLRSAPTPGRSRCPTDGGSADAARVAGSIARQPPGLSSRSRGRCSRSLCDRHDSNKLGSHVVHAPVADLRHQRIRLGKSMNAMPRTIQTIPSTTADRPR